MAQAFRLELAVPATQIGSAYTKAFAPADHVVQHIEVSLKKEKGRISYMTADLVDPGSKLFGALPDVAFSDVPVKLYLASATNPSSVNTLAFEGICTGYHASSTGMPSAMLQIVAHDESFKARVSAATRTFKNLKSTQMAEKLAKLYGLTADMSAIGDVNLVQKVIDIGIPAIGQAFLSDWDQLNRALYADGLVAHVKGKTLVVHQASTQTYGHTFRPGDGLFIDLQVSINHVKGPGGLGNVKTTVPFDYKDAGTDNALAHDSTGKAQKEGSKIEGGDGRTHRKPIGDGSKWDNKVTHFRGRKDEATLSLNPVPDLFLTHLVNLDGVSEKANGLWEIQEIRHQVVPNDSGSNTSVSLKRGTNKQAAKEAGILPFDYKGA